MKKVIVVGCCGAGKSRLARRLSEKTGLPVVHLDRLYWKPNWVACTDEETDEKIIEALSRDKWIIDGNFRRTMELRISKCDTAVFLDYSRMTCVFGVLGRVMRNHGKVRSDMGDGCKEKFDFEFLRFVWNFRKNKAPAIRELFAKYGGFGVNTVILKSRREADRWLETISAQDGCESA